MPLKKMDDETAYLLTKGFWEQKANLAEQSAWWEGVSPDDLAHLSTPLHPGALRYYDETGIELPEGIRQE